jgi:tetratricopeptide (TPR) repeat protein
MRCLDGQLAELTELVALFSAADGDLVQNAVAAVYALPRADACADSPELRARLSLPRDPAAREAADRLGRRVAGVRAQRDAARYAAAATEAHALVAEARALSSPRLLGETLLLAGDLDDKSAEYEKAAEALRDAELAGVAAGDDETALAAAASLVLVTDYRLGRAEESRFWDQQAQALLERSPGARVAPLLHVNRSQIANIKGRYEEALGHAQRALVAVGQRLGPDDPEVATARAALGQALAALGRYEEALVEVEQSIALREKLFGAEHPLVARTRSLASSVHLRAGHLDRALAEAETARRIQQTALGPDHLENAYTLNRIANIHATLEDYEQAVAGYRQVIELGEKRLGKGHIEVGLAHMNLGIVLRSMGRSAEAERDYEVARDILERTAGPDQPFLATVFGDLGTIRIGAGKVSEGEALHRRALALAERTLGEQHPDVADQLALVAEDALRDGHPEEARALAERALRLPLDERFAARLLADLRFTLARALGPEPGDRARARTLAAQARDGYGQRSPRARADRARVEAWLAAHP